MKQKKFLGLLSICALTVSLAGCSPATTDVEAFDADAQPTETISTAPENAEGPLAAADRKLATREVTEVGNTITVNIDYGNTTSDQKFSAPMRGIFVAPKPGSEAAKKFSQTGSPLIVISHLRAPNCADATFAYPCKEGVEEYRFDQGMKYYAQMLAEAGYTVIIPDLGGIFVGGDVLKPYDQNAMWKETVSKFTSSLKSDIDGKTDVFGVKDLVKVDFDKVGLLLHSRSGTVVDPALEVFGASSVKSILAYGPAYDTVELAEITPQPADIPYLAVVGEDDADVGASANLWLGHYLSIPRLFPASVVAVPGLGHMFINETAANAGIDDRRGCDQRQCPDATEHQRILKEIGLDWFNATLAGADTKLPVKATQELPTNVAGVEARWLAYTPQPLVSVGVEKFKGASADSLKLCVNPDPMNPTEIPNACPEIESGLMQILTQVGYLTDATAEVEVKGAKGLALHVAPAGSMAGEGAPLEVAVTLEDGSTYTLKVPATHPALKKRDSKEQNGVYQLGTIRLELPAEVSQGVVKQIQVKAVEHPVELKSVDLY